MIEEREKKARTINNSSGNVAEILPEDTVDEPETNETVEEGDKSDSTEDFHTT